MSLLPTSLTKVGREQYGEFKLTRHIGEMESDGVFVGIDPGVNYGIAYTEPPNNVYVLNGKLPRRTQRYEYGELAMRLIQILFDPEFRHATFLVEDAAFNKRFGQVGLAEVRFGFYYGCKLLSPYDTHIVPPATIRKLAFGQGNYQAGDMWPTLNHNAADAIGCMLAAMERMNNV